MQTRKNATRYISLKYIILKADFNQIPDISLNKQKTMFQPVAGDFPPHSGILKEQ